MNNPYFVALLYLRNFSAITKLFISDFLKVVLAYEDYYIKVVLQSNKHFVAFKLTKFLANPLWVNFLAYSFSVNIESSVVDLLDETWYTQFNKTFICIFEVQIALKIQKSS